MEEKKVRRQIGIDFGTTTTAMAYCDEGKTAELVMIQGREFVPTLIIEGNEKHPEKYGEEARLNFQNYGFLQENIKIKLLDDDPGIRTKAEELTIKYFRFLHDSYKVFVEKQISMKEEKNVAVEVVRTVVTYPGKFPESVRDFLKRAAEAAGFRNVFMLTEAEAAMMYALKYDNAATRNFFSTHNDKPLNVMMIDMGGGTTDIAVFRYDVKNPDDLQILGYYPEEKGENFGGKEIDGFLYTFYESCLEKKLAADPKVERKIRVSIKNYKENTISRCLADQETADPLPELTFSLPDGVGVLNRDIFEGLLGEYLLKFPELVNGAIKKAGLNGKDIDIVLLAGGHSQWYFVRDMLLNRKLVDLPTVQDEQERVIGFVSSDNNKTAASMVAVGAAYYSLGTMQVEVELEFPPLIDKESFLDIDALMNAKLSVLTPRGVFALNGAMCLYSALMRGELGMKISFSQDVPFLIRIGKNQQCEIARISLLVSPFQSGYKGKGVALITFKRCCEIRNEDDCELYLERFNAETLADYGLVFCELYLERFNAETLADYGLVFMGNAYGRILHKYGNDCVSEEDFYRTNQDIYTVVQKSIDNITSQLKEFKDDVYSDEGLKEIFKMNVEMLKDDVKDSIQYRVDAVKDSIKDFFGF